MKFLCIPCDEQMKTQTEGIMPPTDSKSIALQFKCPKCDHSIAMLTNKFETEFVSKIGVELGGASKEGTAPFGMVGSTLNEAKEIIGKNQAKENQEVVWTPEAEERIKRVPFFVRNMARKTIVNYAKERGITTIDEKLMDQARQEVGM